MAEEFGSPYYHVTGDLQVLAGPGILKRIVVNGLATAGDATIYDSLTATGAIIAVLHLDPTTSISVQPYGAEYNSRLSNGLYIDFDATLLADLTVMAE